MIQVKASGGGGLPADWTEEVTATALEDIAKGDAVEYRMYPGEDVFNGSSDGIPVSFYGVVYSGDGNYRAYASTVTYARYVYIQKLINGVFQPVYTATLSGATANRTVVGLAISFDGAHVIVSTTGDDVIYVYSTNDGTNYSKTDTWSVGNVGFLKLTIDGQYLCVGRTGNGESIPAFSCYKMDYVNNTHTLCTVSNNPTTSRVQSIDCDDAGIYWISVVWVNTACTVVMFKRVGDAFAVIKSGYDILSTSTTIYSCAISPDGTKIAYQYPSSPYVKMCSFIDEVVTVLTNPAISAAAGPTTGVNNGMMYSRDGLYLFIACTTSPYVYIYKTTTNPYVKLANPSTLPSSMRTGITMPNDGKQVILIGSPLMQYLTGVGDYIMKLHSLAEARRLLPNLFSYFGVGMAKTAAAAGEPCTATLFKKINDAGV